MYLSKIDIKNYKGIESLTAEFDPKLNVIIGENGCGKTGLIDAIRLLYNVGEQQRDISVFNDDFHTSSSTNQRSDSIEILYEFKGLSMDQKGVLNDFMDYSKDGAVNDCARVVLTYLPQKDRNPTWEYYTGVDPKQKADFKTFEFFQHYYLSPLRNSTKDLLKAQSSILGRVIKRRIDRNETTANFESIIIEANNELLAQTEVTETRDGINTNLENIFQKYPENKVGVQIEHSRIENVVNLIKPFLPFDKSSLAGEGFSLWQNSLGFNNLIYIATILSDIEQRVQDDTLSHYALLIEEPEAHLHPQLLLNLYNFLNTANSSINSQLFITTHSPTLTSKIPLKNLILLADNTYRICECFTNRGEEAIIQDTGKNKSLADEDFEVKRKQLERYIDVTRSQLFYAKSILLVEGISEELLIPAFGRCLDCRLEDSRIELINVEGVSFYPFLSLFNSSNSFKNLPKPIAVITDNDRYTDSKKSIYAFDNLLENKYAMLHELYNKLKAADESRRIPNLQSFSKENSSILIKPAFKTFEFEIALSNIPSKKSGIETNFYVQYIEKIESDKFDYIQEFYYFLPNDDLSEEERFKIALLFWKAMPSKAGFSQDFSIHILENLAQAKQSLVIPLYIVEALNHII